MDKKKTALSMILCLTLFLAGGCDFDWQKLKAPLEEKEAPLIPVEIFFTDNQRLEAYVKHLGISEEGKVYVGGSSLCYYYDAEGNVLGSYNYQRVLFIKINSEKNKE